MDLDDLGRKLDLIIADRAEQDQAMALLIASVGALVGVLDIHTEMLKALMEVASEEPSDDLRKLLARIELLLEAQTADMKSVLGVVQRIEAR